MRLFLIGWGDDFPELVEVAAGLKRAGHEITYWTRDSKVLPVDQARFPRTIFHELADAVRGAPAPGVNPLDFDPPSGELLSKLGEAESLVLTNMNKKFEYLPTTERLRFFYAQARYWHGVLEQFRPDAIVYGFVPHTVYDLLLYRLAKISGIRSLMPATTTIHDFLLWTEDYEASDRELLAVLAFEPERMLALNDLSVQAQAYYAKTTGSAEAAMPLYMAQDTKKHAGWNLFKIKLRASRAQLASGSIWAAAGHAIRKRWSGSNLRVEYEKYAVAPDRRKRYVYVPLNYQPECTTSPMGGAYADQILMIETLSAALPEGWVIYVKEHPYQWMPRGYNYFSYRYKGYYQAIASLPNVFLVPYKMNSYRLIDGAAAVATVTGTPGFEALLRRKSVLIFGAAWYKEHPDVFRVRSAAECREAFERVQRGFVPSRETNLRYLAALDHVSTKGYIDGYNRTISTLTPAENARSLTDALIKRLAG